MLDTCVGQKWNATKRKPMPIGPGRQSGDDMV